jgi:hypothetical protein
MSAEVAEVVIGLLRRAQAIYDRFVATLTPAEAMTAGAKDKWAAKDVVAHIAYWISVENDRLERSLRGEDVPPEAEGEFQGHNERAFEERKDWTWEHVEAELHRAIDQAITLLKQCDVVQLSQPGTFKWTRDLSVGAHVLGVALWHGSTHLAWFNLDKGDGDRALGIMNDLRALYETYDDGKHRQFVMYDLACLHARLGQPDQALALLPGVFSLHPDLRTWAQKDPDLVTLRDLPDFQAMTGLAGTSAAPSPSAAPAAQS